ncbi:MAG: hypothetical protein AAB295_01120, partial [Chloroflexota bacterium]
MVPFESALRLLFLRIPDDTIERGDLPRQLVALLAQPLAARIVLRHALIPFSPRAGGLDIHQIALEPISPL